MPTTPNGTNYTHTAFTNSVGDNSVYALADTVRASGTNIPTIIYCHGAAGAYNQFASLAAFSGIRNWMIDNGWMWIEGVGGGSQPWGNPASVASYRAAFDHVDGLLDIGPVVPFGRSMGGLPAISLYLLDPVISARSVGLIENSGVQNLGAAYASRRWTTEMRAAYGATNDTSFAANSASSEPMAFPVDLWNGKRVLQLVGTADTTVPPVDHGYAMRTRYQGRLALDQLDVREGGDHSATNGSYLQTDAMVSFLSTVAPPTVEPEPEPEPVTHRITAMYRVGDGGDLYRMTRWS